MSKTTHSNLGPGKSTAYIPDPHTKTETKPALGAPTITPAKNTWKPNAGGRK